MSQVQWIGFDLDDTLHEFSIASQCAAQAVFQHICARNRHLNEGDLATHYRAVCRELLTPFTDGRHSSEYRAERMQALFDKAGVRNVRVRECVEEYKNALAPALRLSKGASDVLNGLQKKRIKVAVISEGPHDAQEWTLRQLLIRERVDVLMTSNREGLAKQQGLYSRFRDAYAVDPKQTLIVGDSLENDVAPAKAAGYMTVYIMIALDLHGPPMQIMSSRT